MYPAFVKAARVKERKRKREGRKEYDEREVEEEEKEEQEEERDKPTGRWKREGEKRFRSRRTRRCIIYGRL